MNSLGMILNENIKRKDVIILSKCCINREDVIKFNKSGHILNTNKNMNAIKLPFKKQKNNEPLRFFKSLSIKFLIDGK